MTELFKKLNYKSQKEICIVNAPSSFKKEMAMMAEIAMVKTSLKGIKELEFFLAFVTKQSEVDGWTKSIAPLLSADALVWFAYPKGTSKRYKCDFNRDTGWSELGKVGLEPVRMVAIDEDWSALRFRNVENIKKMTRSFAMTEAGKRKVAKAKKSAVRKK